MLPYPAVEPITRWLETGKARWPDVVVDATQLAAHLQRLAIPIDNDHAHAADLYLACACASGDAVAIAAFDREMLPLVRDAARRIDPTDEFADEVVQQARERLLVSTGSTSRIASYGGQGPLRAWVRIAAMRIAMSLTSERRRNV